MQSAQTMTMMKAHLAYMAMAGKAVKETTSLIQEVAKDDTIEPQEKLQALDHLAAHLKKIQSDVSAQQAKIQSFAEVAGEDGDWDEEEKPVEAAAPAVEGSLRRAA